MRDETTLSSYDRPYFPIIIFLNHQNSVLLLYKTIAQINLGLERIRTKERKGGREEKGRRQEKVPPLCSLTSEPTFRQNSVVVGHHNKSGMRAVIPRFGFISG